MMDSKGMEYVRLSELQAGAKVQVDDAFTCLRVGTHRVVQEDEEMELYISCDAGKHYLDGQLLQDGTLLGIYNVK